MDIKDYVVITVMAAVWIILQLLKPVIHDEKIRSYFPIFAAVLGVLFTFWINGHIDFMLFLQGIASGFAATGLNEGVNAVFFNKAGDTDELE